MSRRLSNIMLLVPVVVIAVIVLGALPIVINRSGEATEPTVGLAAAATLESPGGEFMGTVKFRQAASGVLIMAEVKGLAQGGHAFIIHETGACTPDFSAAGDHFNPEERNMALSIRAGRGTAWVKRTAATCPIYMPAPTVPHGPTSLLPASR